MNIIYRALTERQADRARFVRFLSFIVFMGSGVLLAVLITVQGLPYGMRPSGWPWTPADWYGVWLGLLLATMLSAGGFLANAHRRLHVDVLVRRKSTQIMRFALPMTALSLVMGMAAALVFIRLGLVSWTASNDGWRPGWVWTSARSSDPIVNVAFSADGQAIYAWFKSGKVRCWLVGRDKETGSESAPVCPVSLSSAGIAHEEKSVTAAGVVLELAGAQDVKLKLKDGKDRSLSAPGAVTCLALSGDGESALVGNKDCSVNAWITASGKELCPPLKGGNPVSATAMSFDKQVAASGHEDGKIRLWNLKTGGNLRDDLKEHATAVSVLAFDQSGNRLVSMAAQKGNLVIWDVGIGSSYKKSAGIETPFQNATHLALSPDGRYAIVVADSSVHLWRLTPP